MGWGLLNTTHLKFRFSHESRIREPWVQTFALRFPLRRHLAIVFKLFPVPSLTSSFRHVQVDSELEIKAYYAGHVLGAAMFHVRVGDQSVVYTVSH